MSSFFANQGAAILVLAAHFGAGLGIPAAVSPPLGGSGEGREGMAVESLIEVGSLEEMESARDRARATATEARRRILGEAFAAPEVLPDSAALRWIGTVSLAYARALRQESVRLHRGGTADGTFQSVWTAMVRTHLDVLARWPRLWLEETDAGDPSTFLPARLLWLCSPETYAGESFDLPRDALMPRMASLPESLSQCCIDPRRCLEPQGADCPEQVVVDIARLAELDALVEFRNGQRYWMLPGGVPPRSRSNDAAVANAEGKAALEMLRACEDVSAERGAPGAPVTVPTALAAMRETRSLWPTNSDPFRSVPGLRNPRRDDAGRLACDLAIWEECLAAMAPAARARLLGRLGSGARLIPVRPDAQK